MGTQGRWVAGFEAELVRERGIQGETETSVYKEMCVKMHIVSNVVASFLKEELDAVLLPLRKRMDKSVV